LNIKPLYLSIELLTPNNYNNDDIWKSGKHLEILQKLKELGYTKFVISNQADKKSLQNSQEGVNIKQEFGGCHSGNFGKDIFNIEQVISYNMIVEKYNEYFTKNIDNDVFNHRSWYDIHCTYEQID
jgi:hypothetical protein